MHRHRECVYRAELDMETLVWTRGRAFPLSWLQAPALPAVRLAFCLSCIRHSWRAQRRECAGRRVAMLCSRAHLHSRGGYGEARTKCGLTNVLKRLNGPVAQPDRAAVS